RDDSSLSSLWSSSLDDSGLHDSSNIQSPLTFPAQFHSTPNYWEDRRSSQLQQSGALNKSSLSQNSIQAVLMEEDCQNEAVFHLLLHRQADSPVTIITLVEKMERLRELNIHPSVHSALERWLEGIRKVQARRKEEIVNAANRHRNGSTRNDNEKDITALAAAIAELTMLTRKARTANWCALQMATLDNPDLSHMGIVLQKQDGVNIYRVQQPTMTLAPRPNSQ
ncbi:MEIOC-like protein, partial [Mya arenaria]